MEDWEHIMNVLNHHNSEIVRDYKNIMKKRSLGFSLVLLGGIYMILPFWGMIHNWDPSITLILMFFTFIFLMPYTIISFRTDKTMKKLSKNGWIPSTTDLVFLDRINMILIVLTSFVQGSVALATILTKFSSEITFFIKITFLYFVMIGSFVYIIKKIIEKKRLFILPHLERSC